MPHEFEDELVDVIAGAMQVALTPIVARIAALEAHPSAATALGLALIERQAAIVPGPMGPAGPAGVDGKDGADGADGRPGLTGEPGPAGPIGLTGSSGLDGAIGPVGEKGDSGPPGAVGRDGLDGVDGPVGPAGAPGLDGPSGPAGPAGRDADPAALAGLADDVSTAAALVAGLELRLVSVETKTALAQRVEGDVAGLRTRADAVDAALAALDGADDLTALTAAAFADDLAALACRPS